MSGTIYLLACWARRAGLGDGLIAQSAMFFILALTTSVLAIGSDSNLLIQVLPGLIWVLVLLASLLGLPDLLNRDAHEGLLDDIVLSPRPLPLLMALKGASHWVSTGLPLAVIAPGILYVMDARHMYDPVYVFAGLAAGSLYFSSIGLIAAALVLQARRSFALYAVIVLPLAFPGLIFGAGALTIQGMGIASHTGFSFLLACSAAFATLAPFASAWIVRMKVRS